ncbi:helix-turn-helix domain-containing protein [Shewanella basaltis]|uniref:helix-turn-helix domain-containing protein n=1 Tax=Shewanella TaxID=22 RepID=UPI001CBB1787|nr:helix-turn-helix transcriptional regulator [Shewanella inventionis]UAL42608.1 helix-turn-helix transcriptional regulator [Shewanella inventionis]
MNYVTEQILGSLRDARIRKGFSQRELSARSGVPQSHISKIESGDVDLRMSSLIALARVLDLELFVAPRKTVPAIKSIIRSSNATHNNGLSDESEPMSPAYQLEEYDDD